MKWRLFAAIAGVVAIVLVAHDLPLRNYLRQAEHDRVIAQLQSDAFLLAGSAVEGLERESPDTALTTTLQLYTAQHGGRVLVVNSTGAVVASSDTTAEGKDYADRPEMAAALAGRPTSGTRFSKTLDTDLVYIAVPIMAGAQAIGAVRITLPKTEIDDRVWRIQRALLIAFAISMLTAVLVAVAIAGSLSGPLRRLRASADQVAGGDFRARVDDDGGPPEIRALAASFNTMTERVNELVEQQRAFAGDASHQLRSPLTALRLQLEQATTAPDGAHRQRQLESALAETERLQRLIDGLLMLARADANGTAASEEVDLGALIAERAEMWASLGEERGVRVEGTAPHGVRVLAVPGAVEQILDNFLDNALGVAPDGSMIRIGVHVDTTRAAAAAGAAGTAGGAPGFATLFVTDEGPGLDPVAAEHAFDRLWRAPNAPYQGSGIGLAVVARLAARSGGVAALTNRPDGPGARATVTLPLAVDSPADPPQP